MKKTLMTCAALIAFATPGLAQTAGAITAIKDVERGTMVTLKGVVDRITDTDEFRLRDDSGTIEVDIGSGWVPADMGEAVTVQGFVDDDFGPREIYARTLTRADGSLITFDQRDD